MRLQVVGRYLPAKAIEPFARFWQDVENALQRRSSGLSLVAGCSSLVIEDLLQSVFRQRPATTN